MNAIELGSAAAILVAALLFFVLERRFPYNRSQVREMPAFRPGFLSDLALYGAFQSWVLGVFIGRVIERLDEASGASRLELLSGWPILLQLLFFVVTHDLYIYLFHRLQHRSRLLWRFHEAHHSNTEVDWLSGVRSHPVEIFINQTVEFAPIVLLGAAPEVAVLKGATSAIWGMFIHSNLDVRLGPFEKILNGPGMHRWHHATGREAYGRNFATKLSVWDWLFGTAYLPDPEVKRAARYGLDQDGYPQSYLGQVLHAFLPERRR